MTLAEVVVPTDPDGRGGRGGRRSGVRLAARRSLGAAHARRRALQPNRGPTRHNTGLARHNTRGVGASDSSFVLQEVVIGRYFWGRSNTVEYKAAVAGLTSDRNPPDNTAPPTPTRRTTQKTRRDGPHKRPDAADHTKDPTRRTTKRTRRGGPHKRPDAAGQTLSGRDHVDQLGRTNDHVLDGTPGKRSLHAGSGKCQRPQLVGRDLR